MDGENLLVALHAVINTNRCTGLMYLVVVESNGTCIYYQVKQERASRSINKGITLPGAEIIHYSIQGYHTGSVVGFMHRYPQ